MPEHNLKDLFDNLLQSAMIARQDVEENIAELNRKLAEQKAALRRLDAVLRAAQPAEKKAKPKSSNNGSRSAPQVLEFMRNNQEQEDWTASQLAAAVGLHQSTVSHALRYLRDTEQIRATRSVRGGGHAYATWS